MDDNQISGIVVGAASEVHRTLGGPGLLERIVSQSLSDELELRQISLEREKRNPLQY